MRPIDLLRHHAGLPKIGYLSHRTIMGAVVVTSGNMDGKMVTMIFPAGCEDGIKRWMDGALIQDALPQLTPGQREFLMTGMTDKDWARTFAEEDGEHE